jgi:hypothetical protein
LTFFSLFFSLCRFAWLLLLRRRILAELVTAGSWMAEQ